MHQRISWPLLVMATLICGILCFFAERLPQRKPVDLIADQPKISFQGKPLVSIQPTLRAAATEPVDPVPRFELTSRAESEFAQAGVDNAKLEAEVITVENLPSLPAEVRLQPPQTISLALTPGEGRVALTDFGADVGAENGEDFHLEFDQEVDPNAAAPIQIAGPLKSADESSDPPVPSNETPALTGAQPAAVSLGDSRNAEVETTELDLAPASESPRSAENGNATNETDFDFGGRRDQNPASNEALESEASEREEPETREPENERSDVENLSTGWPEFQLLYDELDALQAITRVQPLADEVRDTLTTLNREIPVGDPHADDSLARLATVQKSLHDLARQLWVEAGSQADPEAKQLTAAANQLSRFTYRLDRRRRVWQRVNQQAAPGVSTQVDQAVRSASSSKIRFENVDPNWSKYLYLDELAACFGSLAPDENERRQVARQTLARFYSAALNSQQSSYVRGLIDPKVLTEVKRAARRPVDYVKLLAAVERFESQPDSISGYILNDLYQNLLWSETPGDQAIASELEAHYRNANFRVAVSQEMLERLIPELPDTAEPFADRMMGADIRGHNNVSNRLEVELIPDPTQLHLRLGTLGQVDSKSIARRDGFTIRSDSQAEFQVYKKILIDHNGIDATAQPEAHSSVDQRVTGVESKLDAIPVLGAVARRIAQRKIRAQKPQTERIVKKRVANDASDRVHELVTQKVDKMSRYIYANLIQPLTAMDLEPQAVQLATTRDQMTVRYRLAGRDQMAAHSARPSDAAGSLLNIQMHQSAINNVIARLELSENKFTTQQLLEHLNELLGLTLSPDPDMAEAEAEFEFARFDPLQMVFEDDRVLVTMNLNSLKIGDGKRWQKVTLTACYRAQCDGTQLHLTQDDEGKRIKGHRLRFRDRATIGTIHQVLFKRDYQFDVLPAQIADQIGADTLQLSQLVIFDGWVGMSLVDIPVRASLGQQSDSTPSRQVAKSESGTNR